ncbi:MAG: VWA domain-containing protein [Nannocystis sp.]|nr:vWA domain-containing protein [Nannocystis sp.]MBA3549865.1 VWA domain-containing protein [Nannocystis sp.]
MKCSAYVLMLALVGACPGEGPVAVTTEGSGSSSSTSSGTTSEAPTTGTTRQPTTEPPGGSTTVVFDPNDCGHAVVYKPNVMLVLDKSGSMVADPGGFWDHDQDPGTATVSRWSSLHAAVAGLVDKFDAGMNLGLVLFPAKTAASSYDEMACIVGGAPGVPLAGMNAANMLAALPEALTDGAMMKGGTPATKGLKVAIEALASVPAEQPRFMLLVTDGAANCQENAPDLEALFEVYDDEVTSTVAAAAAMGIKTFVVGVDIANEVSSDLKDGLPDSVNVHEKLNELAVAGGVARAGDEKFFNPTNEGELQAALELISGQILSCTFTLYPTPIFLGYVEVNGFKEGTQAGSSDLTDCMTQDGWDFLPPIDPQDSDEPLRIELCGAACSDYRMSGEIDIQYTCPAD